MQEYEFRIFPPARLYSPPDGAQVFVKLNSDKHTGLGTLVPTPEGESKTSAADPDHHVPKIIAVDHEANCQGEDASSSAPAAVLTDAGIAATQLPPGITAEGRRLVQYAVGGSAYVRPARFTPVYTGYPSVILCSDTKSFRKLCRTQVREGDSVIDIGASYGASTQVIFEQCGNVLGLDVSKEAVAEARIRYPRVRFELMDVLAEPQRLQEVLRERRPSKVFVDIGGNRELPALVALLPALHQAGVAGVYVKSQALVKSSLRHLRALDGGTQPACSASGRAQHTAQHVGRELPEPAASGVDDIARELEATTIGDGVGDTGGDRDDSAADTCADGSDPERGDVRRARQRRGGPRAQATPRRVLWRWCNQNMPSAWDLDLDLADGGRDGAAPLVREGLAVVRNSCEWWRQLEANELRGNSHTRKRGTPASERATHGGPP